MYAGEGQELATARSRLFPHQQPLQLQVLGVMPAAHGGKDRGGGHGLGPPSGTKSEKQLRADRRKNLSEDERRIREAGLGEHGTKQTIVSGGYQRAT